MNNVILLKEGLMAIQVCTNIPPERAEADLEEAVNQAILGPGTKENRWIYDPELDKKLSQEVVPCADYEGRWHYILYC